MLLTYKKAHFYIEDLKMQLYKQGVKVSVGSISMADICQLSYLKY